MSSLGSCVKALAWILLRAVMPTLETPYATDEKLHVSLVLHQYNIIVLHSIAKHSLTDCALPVSKTTTCTTSLDTYGNHANPNGNQNKIIIKEDYSASPVFDHPLSKWTPSFTSLENNTITKKTFKYRQLFLILKKKQTPFRTWFCAGNINITDTTSHSKGFLFFLLFFNFVRVNKNLVIQVICQTAQY